MADDPKDYEVGYGKPPKHSRFRKGRSGNPKGRTKGYRNLKSDLATELKKRIVVNEGGRRTRVSKQQALMMRLVEQALNGDMRALNALIDRYKRAFGLEDSETPTSELPAEDREILAAFRDQIIHGEIVGSTDPAGHDSTSPAGAIIDAEDADEDDPDDSTTE